MKFFKTPSWINRVSKDLTWSFVPKANEVYLTFDDGPNEEITNYILSRLQELNWKATFFCVGENVLKNQAIFEQIIEQGHAVGNHTHQHLNAWKHTPEKYLENVQLASKVIPSKLFRPPYGKLTKSLSSQLKEDFILIMWSFMAYDFDDTVSHEVIREKAEKYIQPGSIIVLHDNEKFIQNEKAVFEIIVDVLLQKGLMSKAIDIKIG